MRNCRDYFSVIFAEAPLFDRLYGLSIDDDIVNGMLKRFGLHDKVVCRQGAFSTLDLSTGQRKRLAMVVALLENRPVLVLDEWAADQDPEFREYFYQELLPELKARGKTVILVTHDDRYFSLADQLIRLDYGQMVAGE